MIPLANGIRRQTPQKRALETTRLTPRLPANLSLNEIHFRCWQIILYIIFAAFYRVGVLCQSRLSTTSHNSWLSQNFANVAKIHEFFGGRLKNCSAAFIKLVSGFFIKSTFCRKQSCLPYRLCVEKLSSELCGEG